MIVQLRLGLKWRWSTERGREGRWELGPILVFYLNLVLLFNVSKCIEITNTLWYQKQYKGRWELGPFWFFI